MVVRRRPRRAQTTPPHRTNVRRVATLLARGGYLATRACAYVCAARNGCGGAGLCVRACRMCGRVCKYGRWTPAPRPTTHIVEQSTGADAIQRHPTHYATRTHRRGACSRNLPPHGCATTSASRANNPTTPNQRSPRGNIIGSGWLPRHACVRVCLRGAERLRWRGVVRARVSDVRARVQIWAMDPRPPPHNTHRRTIDWR